MTSRFTEMVTEETGRPVIAFMSTSHQHPDLVAELFLLAPTDILDDGSSESLLGGEVGSATARNDHPARGETGSGPA
jgi:hypothetical protein